jgi:hypothetical protein
MINGYKSGNNVILYTELFYFIWSRITNKCIKRNFDLDVKLNKRINNKKLGWRIAISGKPENKAKLLSLFLPYFIPSMLYKLGI